MAETAARPIVFLSDFGYRNEWVGICHAVMSKISPASGIVDLSHGVPPLDVRAGALLLADCVRFLADDAVVLAVVEPNVGRDRNIAVETESGHALVGPDNGLLSPAWRALGGVHAAVEIASPQIMIHPVSPSFQVRDVMSPAAGHLAIGLALDRLGPPIEPDSLAELSIAEPGVEHGRIECEVLDLNRFGNVQLNVRGSHLEEARLHDVPALLVETATGSARACRVDTYADVAPGDWGLMIDARGWLSVIRGNPANAAAGLGVQGGDLVWIRQAP